MVNLKDQKSLEQYILNLQKQQLIDIDEEILPKQLEILMKNDQIKKEEVEREKLIKQIQKSLDVKNELLIKYRIESEDYKNQMQSFHQHEQTAKQEADKEIIKSQIKEVKEFESGDKKSSQSKALKSRKKSTGSSKKSSTHRPIEQDKKNSDLPQNEYYA